MAVLNGLNNVLSDLSRSLSIPLIFFLILALCIILKKNKRYGFPAIGGLTFMIVWRSAYKFHSHRYCIIFIIISIIILLVGVNNIISISKKWTFLSGRKALICYALCFIIVVVYNVIKINSSFRNIYITDLVETINSIYDKEANTSTILDYKEINRIGSGFDRVFESDKSLDDILIEYQLWGNILNILKTEKDPNDYSVVHSNREKLRKTMCFVKNKNKNSFLCFYRYYPSYSNSNHVTINAENKILNGDMEILGTYSKRVINLLSQNQITFYDPETITLPQNELLLPLSSSIQAEMFPEIYADSENAINGKYSLNILFKNSDSYKVFLMNKIKSKSGVLSFLVKKLNGPNYYFILSRHDYKGKEGPFSPQNTKYMISLFDDNVHEITMDIKQDNYLGDVSVFLISSSNIQLLVDNISFTEDQ